MSKKLSDYPIKKRVVQYIEEDGLIRFTGWALVTTTLGVMAEPFAVNERRIPGVGIQDYDPSNPVVRIDAFEAIEPGRERFLMGGEGVTGGDVLPRVFAKKGDFV